MEKNIDLYFDDNYGKLYEKVENGKFIKFELETANGKISNRFLLRIIPEKIEGEQYFDIVTPYGYGGPIIEKITGDKSVLLKEYEEKFTEYCLKNRIVSEFIRFHPLVKNYEDFKLYNPIYMRKTLITKLKEDDVVQNQFSKSARKNIRQAVNRNVSYRITPMPDNFEEFKKLYYITMDRNSATDYYYFEDEYFENILKSFKNNVVLFDAIYEDKIISSMMCFVYNKTIHIHLSGTISEYLHLAPSYLLKFAIITWGIENGYEVVHHGGGRTNSEEDNLYLFKKNFAKLYDVDFYIGKKIWNKNIYDKLCELKKVDINENFFPAYRKN